MISIALQSDAAFFSNACSICANADRRLCSTTRRKVGFDRCQPLDVRVPARSTIHAVLDRHGLVKRGGGPRHRARGTPLSAGAAPNDLWCADFKGEFKLGNGRYCYPLTVTDHASRFLLLCEALESNREDTAFTAFERLFAERGLPLAIRSDNGVPFASPNALFNLSKLAVWWLRLGIAIERSSQAVPSRTAATSACTSP